MGQVRGLLCGNCNRGIGMLQHDITLLFKAADYLLLENWKNLNVPKG